RKRFLLILFIVGACAPAVWIVTGYALRPWSVSPGIFRTLLFIFACVTFPTQILFLDVEHVPEIIFMLLVAAPVNGACYALGGFVFWYLREGLSRLRTRRISH